MRILHISDSALPQLGGIEMHVHDLAARQRTQGHTVRSATLTPGPHVGDGAVIRLPQANGFPRPSAVGQLTALIRHGRFDVVHAHSSLVSPLAWAGVGAAARAGVPAVLTMHSMLPRTPPARTVLARAMLTGVSGGVSSGVAAKVVWTAVSSSAATLLQAGLPGYEVAVLSNGIDPETWTAHAAPPPTPLTVVSVMRAARRKRPLPLLEILRTVRRTVPPGIALRAVVVGAGPMDRTVRRRVLRSGLEDWVSLPGQLPRSSIRSLLHRSHLYLAPATLESFGIAALEARSAGVPVIGMRRGGLGDFITDGLDGLLVDSDAAMAAAAAGLLTDPLALHRLQHHNRTVAPSITWAAVLARHDLIYAAAAELAAPGSRPVAGRSGGVEVRRPTRSDGRDSQYHPSWVGPGPQLPQRSDQPERQAVLGAQGSTVAGDPVGLVDDLGRTLHRRSVRSDLAPARARAQRHPRISS